MYNAAEARENLAKRYSIKQLQCNYHHKYNVRDLIRVSQQLSGCAKICLLMFSKSTKYCAVRTEVEKKEYFV